MATDSPSMAPRGPASSLGAAVVVVALGGLALNSPAGADSSAPPASPTTVTVATSTTTSPLSPLNASLGDAISVVPAAPVQSTPPTTIAIEEIGLDLTPVRPVGLDPEGQLEIPDETEVGWYRLGSWPGQPGATVLAAHVSWNDEVGPFYRLVDARAGSGHRDRTGRRFGASVRGRRTGPVPQDGASGRSGVDAQRARDPRPRHVRRRLQSRHPPVSPQHRRVRRPGGVSIDATREESNGPLHRNRVHVTPTR